MPSRDTIVVRNLPQLTTEADIRAFFNTRIKNAGSEVFSLVDDSQRIAGRLKCAIVELNHGAKGKALEYNGHEFIPAAAGGGKSKIEIDASSVGAVTLASHRNPKFDLYFVHGPGGDAFSSWVNESTRHMWTRDSFPLQCINSGVRGRFSTLGYDAKILDKKSKSFQRAAEEILNHVRVDRPQGCTLPIFFVCHSVGGIVVTQALTLALTKPTIQPELQFIRQMVRGVVYFGTPLQGTLNAGLTTPVVSLVGGLTRVQTNFLSDSKLFSKKLPQLMMNFNSIRNEEDIEVLVFIEHLLDGPTRTTRISAALPFTPPVVSIGINASHRDMVKFANGNEAREISTEIVNMIQRKLNIPVTPSLNLPPSSGLTVLQPPGYEGKEAPGTDDNKGFGRLALLDTIFVIDDTGSMQVAADSNDPAGPDRKSRWNVLTQSMQYIANIAAEYAPDGVGIYFLKSTHLNKTNIKSGQEVLNLLAQVDLGQGMGGTYFATALAEILGPYAARYRDFFEAAKRRRKADRVRPLNVIVLTDGKADDASSTKRIIIRIGKQLDDMFASDSQIGLQFLQVGDDQDAAEWLKSLDNDLESEHDIRDYVDTRAFDDPQNSPDFTKNLREILLGAIDRDIDNQ
ncbi:hypothetical protein GP486_003997 [Trichoglossum hirsutum]|uniref:VWFA domain-containing protein n=1 Tax=Trichoglossum hirsutum TaxID=265104 RepID=A0A9P8LBV7_9PEZI|nr:hypothetical protein GP486_003997 [Trichoglossum hirsutum]